MPDTFTSLLLSSISKENIMTIEKAMRIRNAQFELRHLEQLQPSPLAQATTGTSGDDVYYVTRSDDKIIENPNGGDDTVYSNVSYTLPNDVENLVLTGTANIFGAGNNSNNILIGNEGRNRLNSGRGDDIVYGGGGNDFINGGEGNDHLFGETGNDTLNGEAGNDVLEGGEGDDTYLFSAKSEQDTIIDNQGHNSIRFHTDLSLNDLTVKVQNNEIGGYDWLIAVKNSNAVLTIKNQSGIYGAISEFQFDGNTSYSTGELINHFKLSIPHMIGNTNIVQYTGQPVEELNRDVYNNFNHTIHADSDNSDLDLSRYTSVVEYRGNRSDETITLGRGINIVDTAGGNDTITDPGADNTVIMFGRNSGNDTFNPYGGSDTQVLFKEGLTLKDLQLKTGDDWVLTIKDTGDTLTIHDIANNNVDSFVFGNGKSYTADEINKALMTENTQNNGIL